MCEKNPADPDRHRPLTPLVGLACLGAEDRGPERISDSMRETVSDCTEIVQDFSRIAERSIPPRVLRSAKGIAILRVLKGGFFVSGRIGEGVVIARLPEGGWSGPSAIGTGGAGVGFRASRRAPAGKARAVAHCPTSRSAYRPRARSGAMRRSALPRGNSPVLSAREPIRRSG